MTILFDHVIFLWIILVIINVSVCCLRRHYAPVVGDRDGVVERRKLDHSSQFLTFSMERKDESPTTTMLPENWISNQLFKIIKLQSQQRCRPQRGKVRSLIPVSAPSKPFLLSLLVYFPVSLKWLILKR